MKKVILLISTSNKKYFRVYCQIGIGSEALDMTIANASKANAIKAVKNFYKTLNTKMSIEDNMPESYLTVYAYDERHNYYQSSPISEKRFQER